MKKNTHQQAEPFDEFCREIVQAAPASAEEINAAANAPFLYQRLRAQIAAEQKSLDSSFASRKTKFDFIAAWAAWQNRWHWIGSAVAVGLVCFALMGWQWLTPSSPTPEVAGQKAATQPSPATKVVADTTQTNPQSSSAEQEAQTSAVMTVPNAKATEAAPRKSARFTSPFAAETKAEETEIATEFMALTYAGNRADERGQIVRMEVPRSVLASMGLPLGKELTGDRVTADVVLGDDGVALAIRFVSNNDNE